MVKNAILRELVSRHAPAEVTKTLKRIDQLDAQKRELQMETNALTDELLGRSLAVATCKTCGGSGIRPHASVETPVAVAFPLDDRVAA